MKNNSEAETVSVSSGIQNGLPQVSVIDDFRPVPFYFINTTKPEDLTREAIFAAMAKISANGFGGCIIFNKPPDGFSAENYLSDRWFETIEYFVQAGLKLHLQIWINDGFDYPPGDAGGRISAIDPTLTQKRLVLNASGQIDVVDVAWGFPAFEEPESSRLFIELVYEQYRQRLGQYFGNGITGFFSDADCRRVSSITLEQLNGRPYFPWSSNFAEEFRKQYGYGIEPYLLDIVKEQGKASVRRDYWSLAGELYSSWFRNNYEWCKAHGLLYSFHSSDTGPLALNDCLRSSLFTEGSFLRQARFCDYPGTDHEALALDGGTHYDSRYYIPSTSWGSGSMKTRTPEFNITKFDLRAKYTASAAYLYNRKKALCEAFAATNWGATHQDLRRIAAWQIMQGINFFVPHAVHHRLHGETRYFAPPEFLSGSLQYGLREFNDALSQMCFAASQGELVDPVAVLDPTETVWSGATHCLFELCDHLNRLPVNYIIVDEFGLRENPGRFKCLLLPGIALSPDLLSLLTKAGTVIIPANELKKLPLPDIAFDGGEIHYMHRRLEDGTEMLLAANIWSDVALAGSLRFKGKSFTVELAPGEIAVFNGPYEKFRTPRNKIPLVKLPENIPVRWSRDNTVPLPGNETFRFQNSTELPEPYLLAPVGSSLIFDGHLLPDGIPTCFFDEPYRKISLPKGRTPGTHEIIISNSEKPWQMTYLCGDFDVKVETANDFQRKYMSFYNMTLYMPSRAELVLSPRSTRLNSGDWCEQGAPFYFGTVTYMMEIEHGGGRVRLPLGWINGTCSLKLNDVQMGTRIWEPFEYELELQRGINRLEITVSNTLANLLECYKAPGGLI